MPPHDEVTVAMDDAENAMQRIRRAMAEVRAGMAVDEDGSLDEVWQVLVLKRGCRR